MRNGKIKWIQLKSYCRYPYDSFFKFNVHNVYFKTVILLVDIRFISLPKIIKIIKSTPQKAFFYEKCRILKTVSKNAGTVLRITYIQNISNNKNENQVSRLGV